MIEGYVDCLLLAMTVLHLAVAGIWVGSMSYSLTVVQPRLARYFPDVHERERLLITLANGNRWRVVGLIAVLGGSGLTVVVRSVAQWTAVGFTAALVCYAGAAGVFWYVSWRHWPARVFALEAEVVGFQRRLRRLATAMLVLVAGGFVIAVTVTASALVGMPWLFIGIPR